MNLSWCSLGLCGSQCGHRILHCLQLRFLFHRKCQHRVHRVCTRLVPAAGKPSERTIGHEQEEDGWHVSALYDCISLHAADVVSWGLDAVQWCDAALCGRLILLHVTRAPRGHLQTARLLQVRASTARKGAHHQLIRLQHVISNAKHTCLYKGAYVRYA